VGATASRKGSSVHDVAIIVVAIFELSSTASPCGVVCSECATFSTTVPAGVGAARALHGAAEAARAAHRQAAALACMRARAPQ
jgi:hypothetical protein